MRRLRPFPPAGLAPAIALSLAIAGCGAAATPAPSVAPTAAASGAARTSAPASGRAVINLVALVAVDRVQAAIGEQPTAKCETGVVFGGESCVWTSTKDNTVWLKVEHTTARETATLELFRERMTKTLGLDKPVDGLGQAAYIGTFSSSVKIAVFLGEGRVIWVVINKKGIDAAAGSALVKEIAQAIIARL